MGLARANHAKFIVQTEEQGFFDQYLRDPIQAFTEEKARRESFNQPPFEQWIQIKVHETEDKKRELQMDILKQELENLSGVRVTSDFVIRVPFSQTDKVRAVLDDLNDNFLIDTNAFS